jgi:hypothetical protein
LIEVLNCFGLVVVGVLALLHVDVVGNLIYQKCARHCAIYLLRVVRLLLSVCGRVPSAARVLGRLDLRFGSVNGVGKGSQDDFGWLFLLELLLELLRKFEIRVFFVGILRGHRGGVSLSDHLEVVVVVDVDWGLALVHVGSFVR